MVHITKILKKKSWRIQKKHRILYKCGTGYPEIREAWDVDVGRTRDPLKTQSGMEGKVHKPPSTCGWWFYSRGPGKAKTKRAGSDHRFTPSLTGCVSLSNYLALLGSGYTIWNIHCALLIMKGGWDLLRWFALQFNLLFTLSTTFSWALYKVLVKGGRGGDIQLGS